MKVSERIRNQLIAEGKSFLSNDNIHEYLNIGDHNELIKDVEAALHDVYRALVIDTENDHNTKESAHRVAKMFINEIFSGRYYAPPRVTAFPNTSNYDQIYVTGPITVRSTCAHHMMPIVGKAYIGVYPGTKVIGLSKFNRLIDWIASRPQIQEEMTQQIADVIEEMTEAQGIAVVIQAEHFCMTHRGVKEHDSDMSTSIMRGAFRENASIKEEFFNIMNRMK
ncbi:MAG: GTP cyclohydrolase I [Candidatus Bathyarchaeia archaeon]